MNSDRLDITIDMILCMAIKDLALKDGISEEEARDKLMSSDAVSLIYDTSNQLWTEGPDALIRLYKEIG